MLGFLNIYKEKNVTSSAIVTGIKKKFGVSKVGHMGTLDPMACGLLPLAVGKATRLFDYFLQKTKVYTAIFDFGYETDSLDVTGNVYSCGGRVPTTEEIEDTIKTMMGVQAQMPPKFSAKNVNGKRAYDLARAGQDFELKPKEIEIFRIDLIEQVDTNKFKFEIECSSGTYIRAIGRDIAYKLGTYATMSFLERSQMGVFDLNNSYKLSEMTGDIEEYLIAPEEVFKSFEKLDIDKTQFKRLVDGRTVPEIEITKNTFVYCDGKLIGVATPTKELKLQTYLGE